jgi:Ca-activated chloride channel family protein
MDLLRFASPVWLWGLLLLPLLVYRYLVAEQRHRASIRFSDLGVLKRAKPSLCTRLRHVLIGLRVAGLALLILALARPQSGRASREVSGEGVDIMLTLDVSSSMELKDLDQGQKTRLQVAREVVSEFVRSRQSDRLGLVAFAAQSYTQCPLTLDYGILLEFLDQVQIAEESWDGTAIGMALINACNRLRESTAKSKVVILLTDGVNNAGEIDPLTAADVAAAVGIRVYTIGVGTEGVIQLPVQGAFGIRYQTIQVEIDEKILQEVAARTRARYFRATTERKLEEIYQEIGRLETSQVKSQVSVDYSERYASFLWPGLVALLLEAVLANTRFRRIP